MVDGTERPPSAEEERDEKELLNRRSYLKLSAAAVASVGATGAFADGAEATSDTNFTFDRTLHAVDDLGLDASGGEVCDDAVEAALSEPGTVVEFPNGTFRFRDMWALNVERVGITNVDGHDPEFVTEQIGSVEENVGFLLKGSDILFSGITMNYMDRDDAGGPKIMVLAESGGFHVHSVEVRGYFYRNAFTVQVESPDGVGLMENVAIRDGQRSGRLGSGILVNQSGHRGEITIRDTDVWHTCSGGIYASPNDLSGDTGPVIIENCHFKNNNTASVRVGGTDDVVRNCRFEQTRDTQGGNVTWADPLPTHHSGHRVPRHVQLRNKGVSNDTVQFEGCEFVHDPPSDVTLDSPIRVCGDFEGDVLFMNC